MKPNKAVQLGHTYAVFVLCLNSTKKNTTAACRLTATLYFFWISSMNLDKSTKRIAKRVKKGFQGYPQISLAYFGETTNYATEVVVGFISEEGAAAQEQKFTSKSDAR